MTAGLTARAGLRAPPCRRCHAVLAGPPRVPLTQGLKAGRCFSVQRYVGADLQVRPRCNGVTARNAYEVLVAPDWSWIRVMIHLAGTSLPSAVFATTRCIVMMSVLSTV